MNILKILTPLLLIFCTISIASVEKTSDLLVNIEKKYTDSKTFSAKFSQKQFVKAYEITKDSSGVIFLKRPDLIRWEVKKPDQTIMITSGSNIKIYTPPFDELDRGQLIIEKADKVHSQFVRDLLSGSFSSLKGVNILNHEADKLKLTPKKAKSIQGVTEALVKVDLKKLTIENITLLFVDGNKTEIFFTDIELGKEMNSDLFNFEAPKNTDIIDRTKK